MEVPPGASAEAGGNAGESSARVVSADGGPGVGSGKLVGRFRTAVSFNGLAVGGRDLMVYLLDALLSFSSESLPEECEAG